jgi:hypothetical protein
MESFRRLVLLILLAIAGVAFNPISHDYGAATQANYSPAQQSLDVAQTLRQRTQTPPSPPAPIRTQRGPGTITMPSGGQEATCISGDGQQVCACGALACIAAELECYCLADPAGSSND